jgi:hypothetical protein
VGVDKITLGEPLFSLTTRDKFGGIVSYCGLSYMPYFCCYRGSRTLAQLFGFLSVHTMDCGDCVATSGSFGYAMEILPTNSPLWKCPEGPHLMLHTITLSPPLWRVFCDSNACPPQDTLQALPPLATSILLDRLGWRHPPPLQHILLSNSTANHEPKYGDPRV